MKKQEYAPNQVILHADVASLWELQLRVPDTSSL